LINNYQAYFVDKCLHPDLFIEVKSRYLFRAIRVKNRAYLSFYHKTSNDKIITSTSLNRLQSHFFLKTVFYNFLYKKKLLFIHASAFLVKGKAMIFLGKKGAGKSTIVKLLKNKFSPLCDDIAIIKIDKRKLFLYQVPYLEKNQYKKTNNCYPIAGLYFLKKADNFHVEKIDLAFESQFLNDFCEQISFNDSKKGMANLIFILMKKFFRLYFAKKNTDKIELFFSKNVI